MRKLPEATQLNWASTISKSLNQEAKDAVQSMSTSLPPIQGSQLMDTSSMSSPTSPEAPAKITEHSNYCAICTSLGKICPEGFAMSSDWDEEENQAKVKDNDQKQSQTNHSFSTAMTITLKAPKPFITKYRWVLLKPDFWEHENLSSLSVIWLI